MVVGKLYTMNLSQPCRAVQLTEKALGIQFEYCEIDLLSQDQMDPEYLKLNPQHTVPMYVDQDGTVVWDSHAIMAYLVGKYGKDDSLYPKDLAKRAVVDQRLHFETGNVFAIFRAMYYPLKSCGDKPSKHLIQASLDAYKFLNIFLTGNRWVCGDKMTIADLSLIASITSICCIVPIDPQHTNLLNWIKECQKLPYYNEANGKGAKIFKDFYESLL